MVTLTIIKFNSYRIVLDHIIEMTNIVARFNFLGMNIDENFLVQFIINSLPHECGSF
jgi:hypothetical protein